MSPTWIRGNRIAFIRQIEFDDFDRIMLAGGSRPVSELLRDNRLLERIRSNLAASPDGRSLAFTGNVRLFSTRTDRPRIRFVASNVDTFSWAPTSHSLVVAQPLARLGVGYPLRIVQADGSGLVRTLTSGSDRSPRWSPTGRLIAFGRGNEDYWSGMYVIEAAGGRPRLLTRRFQSAIWSPTGRSLTFMEADNSIWTMRVDGTGLRRIVRLPGPDYSWQLRSWSPKGDRLLVVRLGFLIVSTSGRVLAQVRGVEPAWSRDGTRVAYQTSRNCRHQGIWTVTASGRRPTRVSGVC